MHFLFRKTTWLILAVLLATLCSCSPKNQYFTVLQWNVWQEGAVVPGGYEAIVNEIERLQPDFITLSEVRNYNDVDFTARLVDSLAARSVKYHTVRHYNTGLLSRYPINDTITAYPKGKKGKGSVFGITTNVAGRKVVVYSAHLDYLDEAAYDVRGINGSNWKEREALPESVEEVLRLNDISQRDESIADFIEQAQRDRENGYQVIIGGDFNEPSYADWTEETKNLYDHNGMVVPWTCSVMLSKAGFKDAYRVIYPNILTHPGFTFPSDNASMPVEKLAWAPNADERDRIDFIWYYPTRQLKAVDACLFGPRNSIKMSQRVPEASEDVFIEPLDIWPTDHKAVLVKFRITGK